MAGLGFFAPLPIALFIPFMASQSLAMGEAFGSGFQYGKRRISAMSNEDFNKLTPKQLHIDMTADIKAMIPSMIKSMDNFATLQPVIIKELLKYALDIAPAIKDVIIEEPRKLVETLDILSPAIGPSSLQGFTIEKIIELFLPKAGAELASPIINVNISGLGDLITKAQKSLGDPVLIMDIQKQTATAVSGHADPSKGTTTFTTGFDPNNPAHTSRNAQVKITKPSKAPDTKIPTVKSKPRAPSSVCTKIKKLKQEIISINGIKSRSGSSTVRTAWSKKQAEIRASITAIEGNYDTSGCKK